MPIETDCTFAFGFSYVFTEARSLARKLGCAFIETSAKERINVDEAFIALVREIKKSQQVRTLSCLCPPPPRWVLTRTDGRIRYSPIARLTSANRLTVPPSRDGHTQCRVWVQVHHSVERGEPMHSGGQRCIRWWWYSTRNDLHQQRASS